MVEKKIAVLIGYDDEEQKEISWNGEGEDEIKNLENYLKTFDERKVEKNPAFLDQYKYISFKWIVPYPLDLEKYGLS